MNSQAIIDAIQRFQDLKVLVIGDVILDAYYEGSVSRISPEAPVSILDVEKKTYRLGGAANVARNLKGLGATPILCSVIGADPAGENVVDLMTRQNLDRGGLIQSHQRITTVKTRMISNNHQLMRMDEEQRDPIASAENDQLFKRIEELIEKHQPQAILFEDYDKGVIGGVLIDLVIGLARKKGIKTTVDPKRKNFLSYSGATLFKPNLKELRDGLNQPDLQPTPASLKEAHGFLNDVMPTEIGFYTLGGHGVYITDGENEAHIDALPRTITDVSGAGDTVISTATCALAAGLGIEEIAFVSNMAGGWVCQYPGVVAIDAESLIKEIQNYNTSL